MTGTHNKIRSLLLVTLMVLSVFVGSIGLAGAQSTGNEELNDGGVYFVGQTLIESDAVDGNQYSLTDSDGNFVRQYTADSNGVTIDTEILETGSYTLSGQNVDVSFTLAEQSLDAEVDGNTLTVDSDRAGYTVEITSDDLSDSELDTLLTNEADPSNVQVSGNSKDIALDTSGLDEGSYELNIDVTDTSASANATVNVGAVSGDSLEFEQSVYEVIRGDVGEINVTFEGDASSGQVVLGSEDVNYKVTLDVVDGDDDGNVTIRFNTYQSTGGSADAFSAADSDDSVTLASESTANLDEIISSEAAYDLSATHSGQETDVATLAVNDGSIGSFSLLTAPENADLSTVESIEDASVESNTIAKEDMMVHRLEATGIFGALEAGDLSTLGNVVVSETTAGPNADADSVNLSSSDYTVVSDDEGVVYVVVDSQTVIDEADIDEDSELEVSFFVEPSSGLVDETTELNQTFELVDRTVEFDTEEMDGEDTIVVRAENNASITGTSSVAPGSEFNVRVRSAGDSPFLMTDSVEVQEDGTFEAQFNFSGVSSNTTFEASVTGGNFDERPQDVPGVVEPAQRGSVNIEDQTVANGSDQTVTVTAAVLTDGGFITIHDSTLLDGELFSSVRGTSDYIEPTGEDAVRNVEITLDNPYNESGTAIAMPHLDTNDNQQYDFVTSEGEDDGPYTENGEPSTDSAELTLEEGNESENGSASVTVEDQTTNGETVTVASANLPEGGFVTIHDSTLQDGATIESVRGTSDYLEAGETSDINVSLDSAFEQGEHTVIAMPHMDTNGNQEYDFVSSDGSEDGPYTDADGNIVTASATLTVGQGNGTNGTTGTGTDNGTATATATATATSTANQTATSTPDDTATETTSGDGPGFGVLVALVALVGAALLAVRRNN